jgi:hypothetical protein
VKETRCWVTDEKGKVIIVAGEFSELVSKDIHGPFTHIVVKYYRDGDDALLGDNPILQVFPLKNVFFMDIER